MKINKKDLLNIKSLLEEGSITEGKFSNKEIVSALKENGSVKNGKKTAKVRYINLLKAENVFLFLQHQALNIDSIEAIDEYIKDIFETTSSRDIIQKQISNTKAKRSPSLKGLFVASVDAIDIKIDDSVVTIYPQNGTGMFLFFTQKIELFEDTIIVGVENYQVLWFAQKYQYLFDKKNILFVLINPYMLEWIETLQNEYIHFGDYDLAGVNIYLNKVLPRLKKSKKISMFIPDTIEKLIDESKNYELYTKQKRLKSLKTTDDEIQKLLELLEKYKRGFEQEGLAD